MRIRGIDGFNNQVAAVQKFQIRLFNDIFLRDMFLKILGFSRIDIKKGCDNRLIITLRLNAFGDARANGPAA